MIISLKEKNLSEYTKEEILNIIKQYSIEQLELSQRKTLDEESFNKPSWSEYQAFQLGFQKAMVKLINFLPDRENK
jgi:hypothetical protein